MIFLDSLGEYRFRLVAPNGEIIAASQGYDEKASCRKGIESVKRNTEIAQIFDLTTKQESIGGTKFEVFKDSRDEYRFRLIAANEEIIAASQGYNYKVSCIDGIESVKKNAPLAIVADTTPTLAQRKKPGFFRIVMYRLVYSDFFRGMWWRDILAGTNYRGRYPYKE